MSQGTVLKAYGGFFYVHSEGKLWECRPRGRFKKDKQTILAGDQVVMTATGTDSGVVEQVLPRRNELLRPPIANVDQVLVVFASKNPDPNFSLLDRMLVMAQGAGVKPIICFGKWDLHTPEVEQEMGIYQTAGYQVVPASSQTGEGIDVIRQLLTNKISVFAGPSGVGKSTLLNALQPGLNLKTGEISEKIKRGKHTTRHVELLPLQQGGWVADTPGFSTLNLPALETAELVEFFPELKDAGANCRFNGCLHHQEPGCAVRDAVNTGSLPQRRYTQYLEFLSELSQQKERRF